jgi:phenylalanyl-tRNA synthetase beta subunit
VLTQSIDKTFFKGRAASIHANIKTADGVKQLVVGEFGILHPSVLKHFEIP